MSTQVQRVDAPELAVDPRFNLPTKAFGHQFASIYFNRLLSLRPSLIESINQSINQSTKGDNFFVATRLLDVPLNQRCAIIGTVYKHQKLKPSILAEYSAQKKGDFPASVNQSLNQSILLTDSSIDTTGKYTSDDDSCVLEDDTGRIALVFNQSTNQSSNQSTSQSNGHDMDSSNSQSTSQSLVHQIVTGAVIGCVGVADALGKFAVEYIIPPGFAPQQPLTNQSISVNPSSIHNPRYMVAVSGLLIGHPLSDPLPRQLLADWLIGFVDDSMIDGRSIDCLLIVGNSLQRVGKKRSRDGLKEEIDVNALSNPVHDLDTFVSRVADSMTVMLMPGQSDPSNFTLPQQAFNQCLTPKANRHAQSFVSLPNPAFVSRTIDDSTIDMVLSSGANVSDCRELTRNQSSCDVMESLVNWRHLCPSCPDTLPAYPFTDSDPFLLDKTPHLMITGNQPTFDTRYIKSNGRACRLISLPEFHATQQVAIVCVNDPDMSVQMMEFAVKTG